MQLQTPDPAEPAKPIAVRLGAHILVTPATGPAFLTTLGAFIDANVDVLDAFALAAVAAAVTAGEVYHGGLGAAGFTVEAAQ